MDEETDNAYEILGVSEDATPAAIKKAYVKLSLRWHPDRGTRMEDDVRERTLKMYRINAAKEILLDPIKRAQHDADLRDRRNGAYEPRPRGAGFSHGFRPTPKPRPQGRAKVYVGPRQTPETQTCCSDGAHGDDGIPGSRGWAGSGYGGHGTAGTNAGPSSAGSHAGDMKIHLRVTVAREGHLEVDVQHIRNLHELVDPTQQNLRIVPLKAFGNLSWSARGGKGGDGGIGGDGGDGATGYPGRDATQYSSGTNGGPGGNGGSGGKGTHGSDGGRGGDVILYLESEDAYLLMRVDGCHPKHGVGNRVSGGAGGAAGCHGRGGWGGAGGRGGSSYSWTTTSTSYRYENGRSVPQTVTHYHSNPGGYSGPSGRSGHTPTDPLYAGDDGANGTFRIRLKYPNEAEKDFTARYDLEFDSIATEQVSDLMQPKTYEFGETVFIPRIKVRNTGQMETPFQRVLLRFGAVKGVNADTSGKIFLSEGTHVTPGNTDFAEEGYLNFDCPYPDRVKDESKGTTGRLGDVSDFDPIRKQAHIQYRAFQLGHENKTDDITQISDFQARYVDFQPESDVLHLVNPVENVGGIQGFRSLAPMETSILQLTLTNTSNQELGEISKTERALFLHIYYADDREYEVPLEHVTVRGEDARIVDVSPVKTDQGKGFRFDVRSLPAGGDYMVQLSFKFDSEKIQVSEKAGLQMDLYLQKIPLLQSSGDSEMQTRKKLIQRRLFVASCQPRFNPHQHSDLILVTTTATDAQQYQAWKKLLTKLGFSVQPYSLSRYGHIDPASVVEEMQLSAALRDKLVVVLNDNYVPKPNDRQERLQTCRPSKLIKSVYEYDDSTSFLIVGGSVDPVQHLSPVAVARNMETVGNENLPNIKACKTKLRDALAKQRSEGFSLDRTKPQGFGVTIKMKSLSPPNQQTIQRVMDKRAKRLARWLKNFDPLRPYTVEWTARRESVQEEEGRLTPRTIGNLQVTAGPPRSQSCFSFVEEQRGTAPGRVMVPNTIDSRAMMFATLQAASFSVMMSCYCRNLVLAAKESDRAPQSEEILAVVKDCLVGDFLLDVANYDHGRMAVKEVVNRSPTLQRLRYSESLNGVLDDSLSDSNLRELLSKHLSKLFGAMQRAARAKDLRPWWKPFSRKHRVGRHMIQALDHFSTHWRDVLDHEIIKDEQKSLHDLIRENIKDRKKSRFAMVGIRGRYRATMMEIHSPKNTAAYEHGFRTLRVRRESDLTTDSMKTKKLPSRALDPTESSHESVRWETEHSYRQSVRQITATEHELYVRTDE